MNLWSPQDYSRSTLDREEGTDTRHTFSLEQQQTPPSPLPSQRHFHDELQHQRRQLHPQQDGHSKKMKKQQQQELKHQLQQHQQQQQLEEEQTGNNGTGSDTPLPRGARMRGRGRRGRHRGDRTGSRSMSEMSVRGLDLLRYATLAPDGTYRCIECERVQISKHFKNKYSFQRHAFLYHEGAARKVFPCVICQKEFSRPDKMKQHLKQAHDCNASSPSKSGASPSAAAMAAVLAAGMGSPSLPASALLVNPFLSLSDPASTEGKIGSLKDSGARC